MSKRLLKPNTIQGNKDLQRRPFAAAVAAKHKDLWKVFVAACEKARRQGIKQ